jgi:hypothetical protein
LPSRDHRDLRRADLRPGRRLIRALLCALICGCATAPAAAADATTGWVQNTTGEPELTAFASQTLSEQLSLAGIEASLFELDARLEAPPEGGLVVMVLCTAKSDHLLRAQVSVKAHGAASRKLIPSMMSKAARDLAVDCR